MNLEDKNVLVIGAGLSGIGAVYLLDKIKSNIYLFDENKTLTKETVLNKLPQKIKVNIILGSLDDEILSTIDLAIISPGISTDTEFIKLIREKNIPIWGEIELAYQYAKGTIIAITGTNGKTTTTALTGEIMKKHFKDVFVVGNIGTPFTKMASETNKDSIIVAEISSFQLETIKDFKPHISVLLNITPDHLDRHKTMENYINSKLAITSNQDNKDIVILNYDDDILMDKGDKLNANILYFSRKSLLKEGVFIKTGNIIYAKEGYSDIILGCNELKLLGEHNIENVLAAVAIGISMKIPKERIRESVIEFTGVEHRTEYVATIDNVTYYNDSKATNPDAAIKGIKAMIAPTVLIGGGYNKDSEYDEWINSFEGKVKCLILLGETKDKIYKTAVNNNFNNIIMVDTLEEAVKKAKETARPGDAVLLSPACASWDMFKNYEERGNKFKEYVHNLGE